jgi:hypothetical protein
LRKNFLRRFIEEARYFQNPPLKAKDFIDFCEKRGIGTNESELEFFEKEGLLYPIIRSENPKNSIGTHQYITLQFQDFEKKLLKELLRENKLFDPANLDFQPYSTFKDEKKFTEKISSYYSSFQIYWLEILKNDYKIQFDFAGDEIKVFSNSYCAGVFNPGGFSMSRIDELDDKYKEFANKDTFEQYFNFKIKKECLIAKYENFNKILEFLISIQRFYFPYGQSDSKFFWTSGNDSDWHEKKRLFDPKKELNSSGFEISEIITLYLEFSKKTKDLLGNTGDDWIQLWMRLNWDKKDKLEGELRLGIEYLNWALMLKKFIEDCCNCEIFDIDEISDFQSNDISELDVSAEHSPRKRRCRDQYFDLEKEKNYYNDPYKRLFYLANSFKLDYQPRIMVFVEGKSEKIVFPKIFECFYGPPENLGIEIVNFEGVDKLLSTSENAEKLKALIDEIQADMRPKPIRNEDHMKRLNELIKNLKKTNIVLSNWTSFISYNLEKWQIIPFFVSDNEGRVKQFLDFGKAIKFEGKTYNVPDDWKFLWGINNENKPFKGKDLEFANFTDQEITLAINEVINTNLDINVVKEARTREIGINKLHDKISEPGIKIKIVQLLFANLLRKDEATILERPIIKPIEKIVELANLNHPPVNTDVELQNKRRIGDLLDGERKSIMDDNY